MYRLFCLARDIMWGMHGGHNYGDGARLFMHAAPQGGQGYWIQVYTRYRGLYRRVRVNSLWLGLAG